MTQPRMTMNPPNKRLTTEYRSKVIRDLVKNTFDAVKLPSPVKNTSRSSIIVGEEGLFHSN
ncbi:hypothetical protein SAMN04490192_1968 [Pseudomonas lundensis]|nr:hypothetical protein SAMN04490192_1968 [Pseudomonas lundensis]